MRKIIYISHSVAWTDGKGIIYVNRNLKKYNKNLYDRILKHECQHTMGAYDTKDLALDYKNDISQWKLFKFCLAYPAGFAQYLPIIKVNNIIFYSWLSLLKIAIILLVIGGVIYFI